MIIEHEFYKKHERDKFVSSKKSEPQAFSTVYILSRIMAQFRNSVIQFRVVIDLLHGLNQN